MFEKMANSIQIKIIVAITLAFMTILMVSMIFIGASERQIAANIGEHRAQDFGRSYFDGVNTMMLTGTLDQRDGLRKKLLAQGDIRDSRIIHFPGRITSTPPESAPKDELDQAALAGTPASKFGEDKNGRFVVTVTPIKASQDYLGTNCLNCHQVPDNSILGAVRVTYSLHELDKAITRNLWINGAINVLLFALGVAFIFLLVRSIIISPVLKMRNTMQQIEANSDLSQHIGIEKNDEIGVLAKTIDSMLHKFRNSLSQVAETSLRLSQSAQNIAVASEQSAQGATEQRTETDTTVRIIGELRNLSHEVGASASQTANASVDTEHQAVQGTTMTREAIAGIRELVGEIEQTAKTIERLDERSQNVSNVLEVIRGIAEQTNLLALNAAIEAARAGEMGRGFAVVADEVRKLATRSHESTRSIEEIVSQLQDEARTAVRGMAHAQESAEHRRKQLEMAITNLDQIVNRVADIRGLNSDMVRALEQQRNLTDEANQKVITISGIADHTSGQAVNTRGVSEELVVLSQELNALVARFKLG
ncbi:MAG: HAMP domain-containing protein [Hydrogenophilales bacterium]|nr:HAMP domain-containing protein [Hydrogenophilales bacterium]